MNLYNPYWPQYIASTTTAPWSQNYINYTTTPLTENSYRSVDLWTPYQNCPYTDPITREKKCRKYYNCRGCQSNYSKPSTAANKIYALKSTNKMDSSQWLQKKTAAHCANYYKPTNCGIKYGSYDRVMRRRNTPLHCNDICCPQPYI